MSAVLDPLILSVGIARVAVWAAIIIVGWRGRRVLPILFGVLGAVISTIFSFLNAGEDLPRWLDLTGAFLALPTAVLVLIFVLSSVPIVRWRRDGWWL